MKYESTRGNSRKIEATEAILLGMVPEGGLFVPESYPDMNLDELKGLSYKELAVKIFEGYLTEFTTEEIRKHVQDAYSQKNFEVEDVVPVVGVDEETAMLDLWYGPTAAFKDVALQIMPLLLTASAKKRQIQEEIVILVATSGDTGKSALEGYKDVPNTKVIVFYPSSGVSEVQRLQMVTTDGNNTFVVGVDGNFDDCQNAVKAIFGDKEYTKVLKKENYVLSSANSINIGRLLPQVVYYFWGYFKMVEKGQLKMGDEFNVCVPTGNFGDILAGWYAMKMGLPVRKFVCASNMNKVLTDFIRTGEYDNSSRIFYRTASPSMDILISSNLERLVYEYAGSDNVNKWYSQLHEENKFKLDDDALAKLQKEFYGEYTSEEETIQEIRKVYEDHKILIDTHTAVAMNVLRKFRSDTSQESVNKLPCLVNATASPFKFSRAVREAIDHEKVHDPKELDEFESLERIQSITGKKIHRAVAGLRGKKVFHDKDIQRNEVRNLINEVLGLKK